MPHPVPGGVVHLLDKRVEVEFVVVRRACYLQHGYGDGVVQLVGKGLADKLMSQKISTSCFHIHDFAGPGTPVVFVHFFHQPMTKVGADQQAIETVVANQER